MKTHLLVFTRYPEPGRTKTRLIPALGPDRAARLQQRLTAHTLAAAQAFQKQVSSTAEVHFAGGDAAAMQAMFGDDLSYTPQQGEGLGARLQQAIHAAFHAGADRVIVIGADCPQLDANLLHEAHRQLEQHDVVLGPAEDGGYYLIGLKQPEPSLFQDIAWGTPEVFRQTIEKIDALRLKHAHLATLSDIDHPEDLVLCRPWPHLCEGILPTTTATRLSVIIPTLNEAQRLAETLLAVRGRCVEKEALEILVADGGSEDDTTKIAQQHAAQVVACRRGRGVQMNAGAALASGETLLFMHADAQLPERWDAILRDTLGDKAVAGAFRLRIDRDTPALRMVAHMANLRSQLLKRPYGDQGLFLSAKTFYDLQGFRNWPLMEDFELVQRLGKLGPIALAPEAMTVSARRWQSRGVMRTTCLNQAIVLAWRMGISPQRLARWYRGKPVASS